MQTLAPKQKQQYKTHATTLAEGQAHAQRQRAASESEFLLAIANATLERPVAAPLFAAFAVFGSASAAPRHAPS